jgi:hypothetical protein
MQRLLSKERERGGIVNTRESGKGSTGASDVGAGEIPAMRRHVG